RAATRFFGGAGPAPGLPGKYPLLQKAYHLAIVVIILGVIVTGVLMFAKIDTAWWRRNPYIMGMTDTDWGIVYAIHGFCAMAAVGLIMVHIYFAIRPEKLWITRSMILGWVTRKEYGDHHDTTRWVAKDREETRPQRRAAE